MRPATRALLLAGLLAAVPAPAAAWPAETMTALSRDARKLLPRSLSRLLGEREPQVLDELRRFPPDASRALARDLPTGTLRPETLRALEAQVGRVVEMLREGQVEGGLVRLGGLLRIQADLSDPVIAAGPEGWPPGVAREHPLAFSRAQTQNETALRSQGFHGNECQARESSRQAGRRQNDRNAG